MAEHLYNLAFWLGMSNIKGPNIPSTWDDGSPVDFNNWGPDEPAAGGEYCLKFDSRADLGYRGYWFAKPCSETRRPVCQKQATRGHAPPSVWFSNKILFYFYFLNDFTH